MKLLLDEQVPGRLVHSFPDSIEVSSVQDMGWAGVQNGALLKLAAEHEFDALVTADKNMEHQQSSASLVVSVVVMAPLFNRLQDLIPMVPKVLKVLGEGDGLVFYRIDS